VSTASTHRGPLVELRTLVGSGDRIALFTAPFTVVGVIANVGYPAFFAVGGPSPALWIVSLVALSAGVVLWAWSVVLILTRVPRGELITGGPFAVVKHPLYTAVSLLVLPFAGFLLNTWLGLAIGLVMYAAVRLFARAEERELARRFGKAWDAYAAGVKLGGL
jgi:protein-S-isoprenylcysteine O-methyltransferase Ste14